MGSADPVAQFIEWQRRAERDAGTARALRWFVRWALGEFPQPEQAASLATADREGHPSTRMVLVKRVTHRGFEFYTNYGSRKAQDLDANPHAALLFYWPHLARQVRAEGPVHRLTPIENSAYFAKRPRGSQVGAWASRQSEEVSSRHVLLERVEHFRERFSGTDVPCPDFWGGYRLDPTHIEFWQGRPDRLHERCCYLRQQDGWRQVTLMP